MSTSRHYQPLSVLFSISAVALFSIVVAQRLTISLAATSPRYEENACGAGGLCGNGRIDTGEQCDWAQTCASVDNGQPCDCKVNCTYCHSGENCAFTKPKMNYCSSSSKSSSSKSSAPKAVCGNGIKEKSEACDLGDGNGAWPRTCSTACKMNKAPKPVCGNSVKEGSEQCDLGEANGPKGVSDCSTKCKINK